MKQKLLSSFRLRVVMLVALLTTTLSSSLLAQHTITFDFEDDSAHRTSGNNSYSNTENTYSENDVSISLTYADAVTTGSPLNGSANVLGRIAKNTTNSPIVTIGAINLSDATIKSISYKTKGVAAMSMKVDYSTDNTSWTNIQTLSSMPTSSTEKEIDGLNIAGNTTFYLRFTISVSSSTNSNRDFQLDDIIISYSSSASSLFDSDFSLTGAPVALSFDLYNNSSAQTISYTTSSTGAVTVSESEYVTTSVSGNTITVTPVKKTPSAQTITVSQAADETYAAGSATFTVSVVNSNEPGTSAANPYTVAQANEATPASGTLANVYIHGIVSGFYGTNTDITGDNYHRYYISDDGTSTDQLLVFNGKGLNNVEFSNADDLMIGDEITICGGLTTFSNAPEVAKDNYIVSLTRKEVASIALSGTYTTTFVEGSEFNHNGVVVTATYSDNTTEVVTARATFTEPDMTQIGEQMITVTFKDKTASYNITITELPKHNAIFSINGTESTQEFKEGAAITFPADPADIAGKTFVGWADATINGTTDIAPSFVTSATMGNADVTYYAVFATKTAGTQTTVTDVLTQTTTGITGTDYTAFTGKTATSSAVYAGQCAGDKGSIQLRSNNSNSGVISTTSGGKLKKVTVVWNSNTASGRTLDVYGNTNAYSSATELYATGQNSNQGTKLGSIAYGTSTELTIEGNYQYIGLRSNSGAMYLTSISIDWVTGSPDTYSDYCTTVVTTGTITLTAACNDNGVIYGTFYTDRAYVMPENLDGSVVKVGADGKLDVRAVYEGTNGDVVPANTALLINSYDTFTGTKDYTIVYTNESGADHSSDNMLKGTLTANDMTEGDNCLFYRLTMHGANPSNNEPGTIGFWWGASDGGAFKPGANKAYLAVPALQAARISGFAFDEDGTTTAIEDVRVADGKNAVYNLNGQRVNNPAKGMYIVNGKKVIK